MSEPVTHSDLATAVGPIRGRLDQLTQRVDYVERAQTTHVEDAERDKAELRELRDWMIRSESAAATDSRWLRFLTGGSALGFLGIIAILADLARRLG